VEPDPNDIPVVMPIDRVERSDMISSPVLDPSHGVANYSQVSAMQNNQRSASPRPQEPTPDDHSGGTHLHEINVAEMKSAMFNGIQPGVTLKNEVIENMEGPPNLVKPIDAVSELLIYSLGEFGDMEITIQQSKVFSLVLLLPVPFPSEQIRREGLESELRGIRPIHIPDPNGYILGMIFPEKGVIFSFTKSNEPGVPSLMVDQIAVEPITSWPFELRGERYLTISNAKAKWDLTIAVQLDPNNHRARWLLAKAFLADEQLAEAQRECKFAIQLKSDQPQYHITLAEIIGTAGYTKEARQYLNDLLPYCSNAPQLKGHAERLLGDFYRDDNDVQDVLSASKYYLTAISTVEPLLKSPNPTLRQHARMVQMNAFLSMAQCISLGGWGDKEEKLPQWLDGAETLALKLVMEDNMTRECLLEVAMKAVSTYVNCPELAGLEKWIEQLDSVTEEILSQVDDENTVRKIENKYASALYDVGQVYEGRGDVQRAMQYAKKAIQYFERHLNENDDVEGIYRLANLYYQLGTLEASGKASRPPVEPDKKSHARAAGWFAKAPLRNTRYLSIRI
jgi:tetratricopeptide (TPR) repeat protein